MVVQIGCEDVDQALKVTRLDGAYDRGVSYTLADVSRALVEGLRSGCAQARNRNDWRTN